MKAATQHTVLASIIAALALGGCASTSTPSPEPDAPSTARAGKALITGSRIPSSSTEKMVHGIGGKDYRDNVDGVPDPLKSQ